MVLGHLGGPGVITGSYKGHKRSQSEKDDVTEGSGGGGGDTVLLVLKVEDGTTAKGCRQPPETRRGMDTDSPSRPPEGMQPCQPIYTSDLQNRKRIICVAFLSH